MTEGNSKFDSIDLCLGNGNNDDDEKEEHPRRLVMLCNDILAYGGDDGTISVLDSLKEDVPTSIKIARQFDDSVRAFSVSSDLKRIAIGFEDGSTQIFEYDDLSNENSLRHVFVLGKKVMNDDYSPEEEEVFFTQEEDISRNISGPRFSASIRDLDFAPNNSCYYLAIASECALAVVSLSSSLSTRYLEQEANSEHDQSGIRGVKYSPNGKYLASLGMDGRLCIWNVSGNDPKLDWELHHRDTIKIVLKQDVGELNGADCHDRSCFPVWSGNNECLALPGSTDLQLRFEKDDSFKKNHSILALKGGHTEEISSLCFSPNSDFLISSGRDIRVLVWKLDYSKMNAKVRYEILKPQDMIPTCILWYQPQQKEFPMWYMAGADGTLITVSGKKYWKPQTTPDDDLETQPIEDDHGKNNCLKRKRSMDVDNISDDDFQSDNPTPSKPNFIDDEANESVTSVEEAIQAIDESSPLIIQPEKIIYQEEEDDDLSQSPPVFSMEVQPQEPFSPSSTPLEDNKRPILCWNHIGSIISRLDKDELSGSEVKYVDIEFTNSAARRNITFADTNHFCLASLGNSGAIFATDVANDDDDDDDWKGMSEHTKQLLKQSQRKKKKAQRWNGSVIYFHRFSTFGNTKEKDWYSTLPKEERVVGVACADDFIAIITSECLLRIYSNGGLQRQIIWLEGNPVTIVGRGQFVAVVYHRSNPNPVTKTQQLGYLFYNVQQDEVLSKGPLCALSKASSLSWIGFNEDHSLFVMDSNNNLSILFLHSGSNHWNWSPILDTIDKVWPIHIFKGKLYCVPLRGQDYPTGVRPITKDLQLRMPLSTSIVADIAGLEEVSLRTSLVEQQQKFMDDLLLQQTPTNKDKILQQRQLLDTNLDKLCLKMAFVAMEAKKVELALDIVKRLRLEPSLELALKASDRLNLYRLSDTIEMILEEREQQEEEFDEIQTDLNDEFETSSATAKISPMNDQMEHDLDENASIQNGISVSNKIRSKNRMNTSINPFKKKNVFSPAKNILHDTQPTQESQNAIKPKLARQSTFSTQSRNHKKQVRHII